MSKILQTLLKDEDARITFHNLLVYLIKLSTPVEPCDDAKDHVQDSDDPESMAKLPERSLIDHNSVEPGIVDMMFNAQFEALINMGRALDVPGNDVKIGHWCLRDRERTVKGMKQWSLYWLDLKHDLSKGSNYPIIAETVENGNPHRMSLTDIELLLSIWAVGPDDNRIQKAIKIWIETHFGLWEIVSLKAVRR